VRAAATAPIGGLAARAAISSAEALEVELLPGWDGLGSEWDDLAAASGNVFATRDWTACWWEHLGRGRPLHVAVVHDGGRPVAVVPLYRWAQRPLRVLRFVGHRTAGQVCPACAPAAAAGAAAALRRTLPRLRADVLLADGLPSSSGWPAGLGGRVVNVMPAPSLRLRASWEEQVRSFGRNLRQELGRKERRLARASRLEYRLVTGADAAGEAFEAFLALHNRRWAGRTTLADAEVAAFQRAFAKRAAAAGWLRLWFLELDGRAVAAWYGLRFGEVETYYQAGRDPAEAGSVGTLLLARSIRAAVEDGMVLYRFGPGGGGYKYRFADRPEQLAVVAASRGIAGRSAVAAAVAARRAAPLRAAIRRVLGR
jgi:CelD/BcsL family acetyltransferase involved in cellulose biosynthesis